MGVRCGVKGGESSIVYGECVALNHTNISQRERTGKWIPLTSRALSTESQTVVCVSIFCRRYKSREPLGRERIFSFAFSAEAKKKMKQGTESIPKIDWHNLGFVTRQEGEQKTRKGEGGKLGSSNNQRQTVFNAAHHRTRC